ncbi:MAG: N-glycosylase/DNA lyase [Candidatus Bathyarchaeia archaeon]
MINLELIGLLAQIPIEVWDKIVTNEPEWQYMHGFIEKYGFGRFSVLMVSVSLNDYQLKGRAETVYWPRIRELLEDKKAPGSPEEMRNMLAEFYKGERLAGQKLKRLSRFLSSDLARRLWKEKPEEVAKDFSQTWLRLAEVMRQKPSDKTIVFAMKTLGIALLIAGRRDFAIETSIPVDSRVRSFTKRIGVPAESDEEVRAFWKEVLERLRKNLSISIIHLDSLVWQIGTLSKPKVIDYFTRLGLRDLGAKLAGMLEK